MAVTHSNSLNQRAEACRMTRLTPTDMSPWFSREHTHAPIASRETWNSPKYVPSAHSRLHELWCKPNLKNLSVPEGPSTQYLRTLVPKPLRVWFLEPESLNIGYLDPLGVTVLSHAVAHASYPSYGPAAGRLRVPQTDIPIQRAWPWCLQATVFNHTCCKTTRK